MKNNQEPDWEKMISETIEDALHSGDFSKLKQTLSGTAEYVMKQTVSGCEQLSTQITHLFNGSGHFQRPNSQQAPGTAPPRVPVQRVPSRYVTNWQRPVVPKKKKTARLPSKAASTIGVFLGLGLGILSFQMVYQTLMELLHQAFAFSTVSSLALFLLLMTASFWFAAHCTGRFRKRRYLQYHLAIGGRQVCAVSVLASAVKKSTRFVLRDIKNMIKSGLFPQGHLDDEESCLILTDEAYAQYRVGQANRKKRELEQAKIQENPDGFDAVIAEGRGWIRKIREANDALPGQEISEKLDQLETVTGKIFACVEKHPEKLPEIRRFMSYYLPTTVKLVTSYREFENQPVQGENIQNAKKEILDILDTVNNAFASLLDSLFQNDAIDISADISVLKTMLAQEGLTQKDFDGQPR